MLKKVCLSLLIVTILGLSVQHSVIAQQVNQEGDVMYLTTSPTPTPATTINLQTSEPTVATLEGSTFEIPAGYFPDFKTLMTWLLQVALVVSVLLVLFQLVYAGINWITSGGDKGKTDTARSRIVAAIVGLVLVVASWAIFLFVLQLIGIAPVAVLPSLS